MAVTSLWRVKGYIGKVVMYAMNPEKTTESVSFKPMRKVPVLRILSVASFPMWNGTKRQTKNHLFTEYAAIRIRRFKI